jgi:hypothetical protein
MKSRVARWGLAAVLLLQTATWLVGVPFTRDREIARVIAIWKSNSRDRPVAALDGPYPRLSTRVAFPALPGIVIAYEECTFAPLGGWDAWTIDFWYVTGSKRLGTWVTGNV